MCGNVINVLILYCRNCLFTINNLLIGFISALTESSLTFAIIAANSKEQRVDGNKYIFLCTKQMLLTILVVLLTISRR